MVTQCAMCLLSVFVRSLLSLRCAMCTLFFATNHLLGSTHSQKVLSNFFFSWLKLFTHSPFCVFILHFRCVALVRKFRSFCFSSRNVAHFLISLSFGYLLFSLLSTPSHLIFFVPFFTFSPVTR